MRGWFYNTIGLAPRRPGVRKRNPMKTFKLLRMRWLLSAVLLQSAVCAVLAVDYRNPLEVQRLLEQRLRQPQAPSAPPVYYYADGVAHFDGLIPFSPTFVQSYDATQPHYRFTCQDGLIIKCEYRDGTGKGTGYFGVWYNNAGAPVLSTYIGEDGQSTWYEHAEYGASGKLQATYRFSATFELRSYKQFSYEGSNTSIKRFRADGTADGETLYEDGGVFLINKGEKRRVNTADRAKEIQTLVKFGLKPFYPAN
jgi:hypothetical protein